MATTREHPLDTSSQIRGRQGRGRTDFERIAVVNRGEPALRLIHAVREFNEVEGTSMRTIALFTTPDRHAMFVREADEAFDLGTPTFVEEEGGPRKVRYLDLPALRQALVLSGAEAVWPGWGFVAERADFVELCDSLGITFIGPDAAVMRLLGDKIASKTIAEKADVPVAPWSGGPVESLDHAFSCAKEIGFPLMIKATAGGGGRGVRRVNSEDDLADAFSSARAEAESSFGDATVFLERMLEGAHHVEVQVVADHYGNAWAVGVRDCSIQRRYQKLLEESASPVLTESQHQELLAAAERLVKAADYTNAGTVEFLYQPEDKSLSFMEVNTRLQVEHPVTEVTTGLDLVSLQLHIARGGRLEGRPPEPRGHAIEVRLNAEDPDQDFAPAPGDVTYLRLPAGPGIRVDRALSEGDTVPAEFDSMIAKIIAWGSDRRQAIARLRRALLQCSVMIDGGSTNKSFLLQLLSEPDVIAGRTDVGWLERTMHPRSRLPAHAEVALLQAAIDAYEADLAIERAQLYGSAARGRAEVPDTSGHSAEFRYFGERYHLDVKRYGPRNYRVAVDGRRVEVAVDRMQQLHVQTTCFGRTHRVISAIHGLTHIVEVDGVAHRLERDEGDAVRAPSPAVVVAIPVKPGDEVGAGDRLVVIEAMKNEMAIVAPYGGRIGTVEVTPGVQVNTGTPLLRLEPVHTTDDTPSGQRVSFAEPEDVFLDTRITSHSRRGYDELRCLMLGFDSEPRDLPDLLRRAAMRDEHPAGVGLAQADVLTVFTDICALASRTAPSSSPREEEVHSRREHFLSYLKSLDTPLESWPGSFVEDLKRGLSHYNVTTLDHTPELEDALFWISKAHLRISEQIPAVMSILDRRLSLAAQLPPSSNTGFRVVLDRLIDATQTRFPAVADLAREVRYAYYDKPLFESARARVYEEMTDHLAHLAAEPHALDRELHMQALVDCPQPMQHYLTTEFADTTPEMRTLMFEVMVRRYYRIRAVGDFGNRSVDGYEFGTAKYRHAGSDINVITSFVDLRDLDRALAASAKAADQVPPDEDVMVDVFTWKKTPGEAAETVDAVHAVVAACSYSRPIRRLMVAVCSADKPPGQGGAEHFTFRERDGQFIEEEVLRGIHPMMARRLQFWRLQNFDLDRLDSAEDVYLFHGVARDNERDERLFALAEVRDLTPIRDESGHVIQLPAFERALIESLDGIRRFQAHRPAKRRVHSNLVTLYCWPVLDISPTELHKVVQRMAPAIEGLDLDEIVVRGHVAAPGDDGVHDVVVRLTNPAGTEIVLRVGAVSDQPVATMTDYHRKVVQMRRRGLTYPYEIVRMLTPDPEGVGSEFPPGSFVEYDFDEDGHFVAVDRPWGTNNAGMIVGLITNNTLKHPEGVSRVMILGDPTRALGALAEPECVRVNAALDLAEQKGIPVEWFAVSSGAKISMDSGTENLDWVARTLRRIIEFTQAGGEINVIVDGINVGGQPYWNAEATMLQHTRGILIMTPDGAMVLTGKLSLDFSGSVSAEDNHGIGGYDRIMGPNSQGQYFAIDLAEACKVLLRHYEHTYVAPAERFPRRAATSDPVQRDVRLFPHPKIEGADFTTVGDIFSDEHNPGRKKPFDIRAVMRAVSDQDMQPLERWRSWRHSDTAIVWEAHIGGYPVCLLGIEGRPIQRRGFVPADGPSQFTSGTLFPQSSKKVMRAINSASGNRPVVVLANLTGFDGSPESMRNLQLEYGAEIGRAVVNFEGPMVLCVVSRYHGGAFVVFSAALNEGLEVAAVEGSYASVIGGAPAAGVVFAREVDSRTQADDRIASLQHDIDAAEGSERASLRARMAELYKVVRSEKLAEVADEFDAVHSVQRAQRMGSVHRIIPAETLRPYLVDAIERGMGREMERIAKM